MKRSQAKKLLTRFIREIADEQTESVPNVDGTDRAATKAEALARLVWNMALGKHKIPDKLGMLKVQSPDKGMIELIYERMEGKVGTSDAGSKEDSIPDKISQSGIETLNRDATGSLKSSGV